MGSKILVIDSDADSAGLVKSVLENENVTVRAMDSAAGAVNRIIEEEIDAILLSADILNAGGNSHTFLSELQNTEKTKDIPVIIINDPGIFSAPEIKKALDNGAYDFINKPSDPFELTARAKAALKFKTRIDALKESAERDSLTKLYNKRHFNEVIEKHISRIMEYEHGLALVMIDGDHFKKINDNYGHTAGDAVVAALANAMDKSVKSTDIVCRFGGDEFSIILPDTSESQAFEITERIRRNVSRIVFNFKNEEVKTTVSSGVSHSDSDNIKTAPRIINEADAALYKAKHNGRNRTEIFI